MNDDLSYHEEAQIDDLIAAFVAKVEAATDEMRRKLESDIEAEEVRRLELWWAS